MRPLVQPTSTAWTDETAPAALPKDSARTAKNVVTPGLATQKSAWWQWPHLLSLDAPFVAIAWLFWWAQTRGVRLAWPHPLILGLAVWMIYLGDRLADVARADDGAGGFSTDRHVFYARHRRAMACLLALVIGALVALTPFVLSKREFSGGLMLLTVTAFYFWMIHHAVRRFRPCIPKEGVVGGMFAIGTAFFVICAETRFEASFLLAVILFGFLCFLNCALISSWEQNSQDWRDEGSLLRAFPRLSHALPELTLVLAVVAGASTFTRQSVDNVPVLLGALALWALDRLHTEISTRALRVLADVALLTPLVAWGCRLLATH